MTKRTLVVLTAVVAIAAFAAAGWWVTDRDAGKAGAMVADASRLVRPHSPIFGPKDAPVTIVEFLDPACETCRAFYPVVKDIMAEFPGQVRLVMRYTPLHQGSDEVVRLLEAARLQGKFQPVLEAVLQGQPEWASHGAPRIENAWKAAGAAGLDIARARAALMAPEVTAVLEQDVSDSKAVGATKTPTFVVNGKHLPSFGAQQLYDLVESEYRAAHGKAGG
ncbi:thioredoxin domain-containing protein [Magnetospirillum sp. 64-120]|uniref:DsbA family protein n=1 Tax=Magnetospirillum sp. 64-120 TaxID=1895778 RepID=UPI000927FCAB|nr:thioredoxin domain-containing protein [Magnetospirillum sp. 64-120]OJX79938.1 MAG: disulfide bond formation protein DsbA [Magnetospirillum sp. 64-120]